MNRPRSPVDTATGDLFSEPASPGAATALTPSTTLELLRRSARTDRAAGALLVPYAAWNTFAIALNVEVVRRNPDR